MKLVGDLKEKVEKAKTQEEAKELIRDAGMELTAEELKEAAGGYRNNGPIDQIIKQNNLSFH